jgi:hypothetical protein
VKRSISLFAAASLTCVSVAPAVAQNITQILTQQICVEEYGGTVAPNATGELTCYVDSLPANELLTGATGGATTGALVGGLLLLALAAGGGGGGTSSTGSTN